RARRGQGICSQLTGPVAQSVEQRPFNPLVLGSSPSALTTYRAIIDQGATRGGRGRPRSAQVGRSGECLTAIRSQVHCRGWQGLFVLKRSLSVTIAGQRISLRSDADEAYVQLLADFVDEKIRDLQVSRSRAGAHEV